MHDTADSIVQEQANKQIFNLQVPKFIAIPTDDNSCRGNSDLDWNVLTLDDIYDTMLS